MWLAHENWQAFCQNQLNSYVAEKRLPHHWMDQHGNKHLNDPLEWWRDHASKYPTLALLARKYLALQATSAATERIFSLVARIMENRAGMKPENAGAAMFVADNLDWYETQQAEQEGPVGIDE